MVTVVFEFSFARVHDSSVTLRHTNWTISDFADNITNVETNQMG